jgi:hypothetical protein
LKSRSRVEEKSRPAERNIYIYNIGRVGLLYFFWRDFCGGRHQFNIYTNIYIHTKWTVENRTEWGKCENGWNKCKSKSQANDFLEGRVGWITSFTELVEAALERFLRRSAPVCCTRGCYPGTSCKPVNIRGCKVSVWFLLETFNETILLDWIH